MWSIRIALGGAVLVAAMASANAQTARMDPHAGPLPLLEINQQPVAEPSPVVADEPARQTDVKPRKGIAATRSQRASPSPGNAARPQATATRSRASQRVAQGTAWPAAYADAPSPKETFPLASPSAPDPPKEPAHLVLPSALAAAEQVRPATVRTPSPQPSVPTMVVTPEAPARIPQGANTSWLVLGTLSGGVVGGIVTVWFLMGLRTARARTTPRRTDAADEPARQNRASADDSRRDDRALEYDEGLEESEEWGQTNPPWRDNRASVGDDRLARSEQSEETGPPWRRNRTSAHNKHRDDKESDPRRVAPAYDAVRVALRERREAPPSSRNVASAYDAFFDALRETEEADQPSDRDAASAYDAVRDARPPSATPAASDLPDQLGTTPQRAADTRQRDAGKMLYVSLEQEMTSLLGRPTGKKEDDHLSGGSAASAYGDVRHRRPGSATPAEFNPLDRPRTAPRRAAQTRQPNATKTFYDSLEQEITSLLGRRTGKNAPNEEADQASGRKAASAYDAVRVALRKRQEADQPSGYNAASVYDAVTDVLGEMEAADQASAHTAAFAYDGVRDALGETEEADQPIGYTAASYDAVRDTLGEAEKADRPSGYNAASAYDAVRDALSERAEVYQPSGGNAASTDDDALRDSLREWAEADQAPRPKWL